MRILFVTQNKTLDFFYNLAKEIKKNHQEAKFAFAISDSLFYRKWIKQNPEFLTLSEINLFEWEIHQRAKKMQIDDLAIDRLKSYEKNLNLDSLFRAAVADRRVFTGKKSSLTQDYKRRFSDDEINQILLSHCVDFEKLIYDFKPTQVITFICVTILDYLAYYFSKAQNIKYQNIRPTRIGDRIIVASSLLDPSPELVQEFERLKNDVNYQPSEYAKNYLESFRKKAFSYAGVVSASDKPAIKIKLISSIKNRLKDFLQNVCLYYSGPSKEDNSVVNPVRSIFYNALVNPIRAKITKKVLGSVYFNDKSVNKNINYIFYPLHAEPEVSMLVYGVPYFNQIEIIRAVATSLPIGSKLLVKEHPWMVGKRHLSYYKKILNIPNVIIVSPAMSAFKLLNIVKGVFVITGSVALEAIMLQKPASFLGHVPFNVFTNKVKQRLMFYDLKYQDKLINSWLIFPKDQLVDDNEILMFIDSTKNITSSIDLYGTILERRELVSLSNNYGKELEKIYKLLFK